MPQARAGTRAPEGSGDGLACTPPLGAAAGKPGTCGRVAGTPASPGRAPSPPSLPRRGRCFPTRLRILVPSISAPPHSRSAAAADAAQHGARRPRGRAAGHGGALRGACAEGVDDVRVGLSAGASASQHHHAGCHQAAQQAGVCSVSAVPPFHGAWAVPDAGQHAHMVVHSGECATLLLRGLPSRAHRGFGLSAACAVFPIHGSDDRHRQRRQPPSCDHRLYLSRPVASFRHKVGLIVANSC